MRILIAEDDHTSRIILAGVLKKHGHEVVVTVNGEEAWCAFQQPDSPRLAILDWMMPGMSGVEVCRRVRGLKTDQPPYIIMLTSKGEKEDIVTGLESGADDYLSKPFVLEELRARVDVGRRMLDLQAGMANKVHELTHWQNQMVRELKVAAQLQTKLLSTPPLLTSRHEVRMLYHPCQHVGGDFFDALELPDGRLCVYVGDVVGHGVGPAMLAALMKAIVSDVSRALDDSGPAALCREISNRFREQVSDPDVYVTLFLLLHDAGACQWRGMNCGHPPPLLLTRSGLDLSAALSRSGSLPIGIDPTPDTGVTYDESAEVVAPASAGDLVFLFTDGLLEARHHVTDAPCGTVGLSEALTLAARDSHVFDYPVAVVKHLADSGFTLNRDDCCALSVRLTVPSEQPLDMLIAPADDALTDVKKAVESALAAAGWTQPQPSQIAFLAETYLSAAIANDRIPLGSKIRLQVRLIGDSCRLLFSSQGRECDPSVRLADLRKRLLATGSVQSLPLAEMTAPSGDLFRRGSLNMAHFAIPRT